MSDQLYDSGEVGAAYRRAMQQGAGSTDLAELLHNKWAAEAERDRYRAALHVAADDLDKAANQFAGLAPMLRRNSRNAERFAAKAKRAREAADA